jgi:O-antigen ligase
MALNQAQADMAPVVGIIKRYTGFSSACTAICMFSLLRWGIKGMLQPSKPWRLGLLLFGFALGMLSGFRSAILVPIVTLCVQFFTEGLHKTRYAVGLAGFFGACVIFLAAFSESLPLAAQRAISFLPVRVDPVAAMDARTSLLWRFEMWRVVVNDVLPNHLWFGKGYAIDPADIYLAEESVKRGFQNDFEMSVRTGDYHSGPLSVLVPFGIVGTVPLILFLIAGARVMYRNYKFTDPETKNINTFLLSYFLAQLVYFILFFGGIEADLWVFASTIGISLTVNGGLKERVTEPKVKPGTEPGALPGGLTPAPA